MTTRDDIYLQPTRDIGTCVMSVINAIQRYPVKTQVVAASCLLALIYNADLIEDISVPELMTLAERLIRSRDARGISGADAYMKGQLR